MASKNVRLFQSPSLFWHIGIDGAALSSGYVASILKTIPPLFDGCAEKQPYSRLDGAHEPKNCCASVHSTDSMRVANAEKNSRLQTRENMPVSRDDLTRGNTWIPRATRRIRVWLLRRESIVWVECQRQRERKHDISALPTTSELEKGTYDNKIHRISRPRELACG